MEQTNNTVKSIDYLPLSGHNTQGATIKAFLKQKNTDINILNNFFGGYVFVFAGAGAILLYLNKHFDGLITHIVLFEVAVTVLYVLLFIVGMYISFKNSYGKSARINDFANANNFVVANDVLNPAYKGVIFDQFSGIKNIEIAITIPQFSNAEIGNYAYGYDTKKSNQYRYGYVKMTLTRQLPHIILDSKANNTAGSNLPLMLDSNQKFILEGDFNNFFTVYAPKGYERDALYIFTPDVMNLLVTKLSNYDIEIINNELYLYKNGYFDLSKPTVWHELGDLIYLAAAEFNKQTQNYSDQRVADKNANIVAVPGQKLKKVSFDAVTLLIIVLFCGFTFFIAFQDTKYFFMFIAAFFLVAIVYKFLKRSK